MNNLQPVDTYIAQAQPFALPILLHIRACVQEACPSVQEALKWGMPHFMYKDKNLCAMAAFKAHCSFLLSFADKLVKPYDVFKRTPGAGMGHVGKITSLKDLPSKKLIIGALKESMKLIDEGVKMTWPTKKNTQKEIVMHPTFLAELKKNNKARTAFETFAPSHQWEYTHWVNEAKTEATRLKRIGTAIEWLAEGKNRNWKYERPKKSS